ncbi:hypothetical protein MTO96_033943 [Rhipicephalus appendiculatus]
MHLAHSRSASGLECLKQLKCLELLTIHWLNQFIISCCILHNLGIDYEPDDDDDAEGTPNAIQWQKSTDDNIDETDEEQALRKLGEIKRAMILAKLLQKDCGELTP